MSSVDDNKSDFEALYRSSFRRLCAKAYQITLDKKASEDIVQDAFISLWKQRSQSKVIFQEAYLYRSVINGALNFNRRHRRLERSPDDNRFTIDTPLTNLQSRELEDLIQKTISSLPPVCQEVFLLSRYEEMSYQEIASFLSISVNTVEKHIVKALQILRKAVSEASR
jgi:RNA polymerase sigma-70 factor (family 1)